MATALATPHLDSTPREDHRQPDGGGRLTLEQRLGGALEAARATGTAECPVCSGELRATADWARCLGCGSRLR